MEDEHIPTEDELMTIENSAEGAPDDYEGDD